MGQYFQATLKDSSGNFTTFSSHDYDHNGSKLTEHSYINILYVIAIVKQLYCNPQQVAWVGDYAEKDDLKTSVSIKEVQTFINHRMNDDSTIDVIPSPLESDSRLVLVNHTKKEYIWIQDFFVNNIDEDGRAMHPLPLLTAIGNGKGGGDYHGINEDQIGRWCCDTLEYMDYTSYRNKNIEKEYKDMSNDIQFHEH